MIDKFIPASETQSHRCDLVDTVNCHFGRRRQCAGKIPNGQPLNMIRSVLTLASWAWQAIAIMPQLNYSLR
ncbi:MAG: hypothetical protein WCL27_04775 [Betaproteobacteria bacterium]